MGEKSRLSQQTFHASASLLQCSHLDEFYSATFLGAAMGCASSVAFSVCLVTRNVRNHRGLTVRHPAFSGTDSSLGLVCPTVQPRWVSLGNLRVSSAIAP